MERPFESLPFKLRLELRKRLGNLELQFLKSLGDRRPIIKRYLQMKNELHVHFLAT